MPEGEDVTVPEPDPDLETVSGYDYASNVALTYLDWVMETTHVPVPEHPAPDQPENVEPEEADAESVTEVPNE